MEPEPIIRAASSTGVETITPVSVRPYASTHGTPQRSTSSWCSGAGMPTWIDSLTLCRRSSSPAGAFSSRLAVEAIPNSTVTSRSRTTGQ